MPLGTIQKRAELPPLPLTIYTSEVIAETHIEAFGDCLIVVGISHSILEQLRARATDPTDEALARTSDRIRFASAKSFETWYAQPRMPFVLMHKESDDLMAIAWLGPKPLGMKPPKDITPDIAPAITPQKSATQSDTPPSEDWDTLSFRSYPPYRGGGFMTSFVGYVLDIYRARYPHRRLWAGIDSDNPSSQALAHKLGFTLLRADSDTEPSGNETRLTMVIE